MIEDHLEEHERVLWEGRPRGGIVFRSSDVPGMLGASVLLLVSASFIVVGAMAFGREIRESSAFVFFLLFFLGGVGLAAVGLFGLVAPFALDARRRARTRYLLTNRRAIVVSGRRRKSFELGTLGEGSYEEKADGTGTVSFGRTSASEEWLVGWMLPFTNRYLRPRFEMVAEPRRVHGIVLDARRLAGTDDIGLG